MNCNPSKTFLTKKKPTKTHHNTMTLKYLSSPID